MLYPWVDWHRASLTAWLKAARLAASVTPLARVLHPPRELFERTLAASEVSERSLELAVTEDAPFPVQAEAISATPFVRLLRLRRPGPQRQRFVVLAPHSGYATAVISPLVTALLAMGEVVISDWVDARLAPTAAGGFGLAQQIEVGLEAAMSLDGPAHLVGISQSGPALLAARGPADAARTGAAAGERRLPRLPARPTRGANPHPADSGAMAAGPVGRQPDRCRGRGLPGSRAAGLPGPVPAAGLQHGQPASLCRRPAWAAARAGGGQCRRLRAPACRPPQPAGCAGRAVPADAGLGARSVAVAGWRTGRGRASCRPGGTAPGAGADPGGRRRRTGRPGPDARPASPAAQHPGGAR